MPNPKYAHRGNLGWINAPVSSNPFAKTISNRRLDLKLNIRQMADLIGVAKSRYSMFESGDAEPRISEFIDIAKRLNLNPSEFFQEILQ